MIIIIYFLSSLTSVLKDIITNIIYFNVVEDFFVPSYDFFFNRIYDGDKWSKLHTCAI